MGVLNFGGIASAFSTNVTSQKKPFWDTVKTGLSSFEKSYRQHPPQNTTAKSGGIYYQAPVAKKNNMMLFLGLGGVALVAVFLIMK